MKIAVVGTSRSGTDPKVVRLVVSLAAAGHSVMFTAPGVIDDLISDSVECVIQIDTRWPRSGGAVARKIRRANPRSVRDRIKRHRLARSLRGFEPDLVYALNRGLAGFVDELGFVNAFDGTPPNDVRSSFVATAPRDLARAGLSESGGGVWVERPESTPAPGRHQGRKVVLCYHPTDTTPARYLHSAFERAGVEVDHRYPDVDLTSVGTETDAVVFVESPFPALDVRGRCEAPVMYWVHHGEIHLNQNIRLAQRYGADIVLLAHSWHLAHRFACPTAPFPFGVPIEMVAPNLSTADRGLAVSMIAAGFDGSGERYAQRREFATAMEAEFGEDRTMFTGGLDPEEMFAVYGDSQIVIDEGGSRHRPITMRVFEATGSGATLATVPAPGLDMLFEPGQEFLMLDPDAPVASLMEASGLEAIAAAGRERALGVHTYDHRVDELLAIADGCEPSVGASTKLTSGGLAAILSRFAEVDSVACTRPCSGLVESGYLVVPLKSVAGHDDAVDVVVIDEEVPLVAEAIMAAHRYVVASHGQASTVEGVLIESGQRYSRSDIFGMVVFDFLTPGYIVRDP